MSTFDVTDGHSGPLVALAGMPIPFGAIQVSLGTTRQIRPLQHLTLTWHRIGFDESCCVIIM